MNDLKASLQNFLETIEYPDNKEEFINKLISTMYLETLDELLNTLPQDKREALKQQFTSVSTPEAMQEIVNNNFDQKTFEEALKRNSRKIFTEYVDTISPTLSEEQRVKLQAYLSSVVLQQTQTS